MLQIFGGMIIGSIMTMMLLGGASAADQLLANAPTFYVDQRLDTTVTLLFLVVLSIFLAFLTPWPTQPIMDKEKFMKQLRRHCS
jgi:uncharacterized membrane protein YeiH